MKISTHDSSIWCANPPRDSYYSVSYELNPAVLCQRTQLPQSSEACSHPERVTIATQRPAPLGNFERHCSLLAKSKLYSWVPRSSQCPSITTGRDALDAFCRCCSCWVNSGVRLASLKSKRSASIRMLSVASLRSAHSSTCACTVASVPASEQAPRRSRRWYRGSRVGSSRSMQGHWGLGKHSLGR